MGFAAEDGDRGGVMPFCRFVWSCASDDFAGLMAFVAAGALTPITSKVSDVVRCNLRSFGCVEVVAASTASALEPDLFTSEVQHVENDAAFIVTFDRAWITPT